MVRAEPVPTQQGLSRDPSWPLWLFGVIVMLTFCLRLVLFCAVILFGALGLSPAKASNYEYDVNFSIPAYGNSGQLTVTGDIITTCNQCFLNQFDVVAYQFNFSNPGFNGAVSSSQNNFGIPLFFVNPTPGPPNFSTLVALPTGIIFDPEVGDNTVFKTAGTDYFENIGQPFNTNSLILSFASLGPPGYCSANCGLISLQGPGGTFENLLGSSALFWSDDFETIADFGCLGNFPGNCFQGFKPPLTVQFNGGGNFVVDGTPLFVTTPTPLPAAFSLLATGLGAIGLLGWRRKRKSAAAIANGVSV